VVGAGHGLHLAEIYVIAGPSLHAESKGRGRDVLAPDPEGSGVHTKTAVLDGLISAGKTGDPAGPDLKDAVLRSGHGAS
jgi:hypothetical protein